MPGFVTPLNTICSASPAAVSLIPESVHALARLAGIVHDPIASVGDLVRSYTVPFTNPLNVVPAGKPT